MTHRETAEAIHTIERASGSGDLETIVALVDELKLAPENLQHSLLLAVASEDIQIARYLLDKGASIDSGVVFAAAYKAKSIPVFELLVEYGWDINAPVKEKGSTALSFVVMDEPLVRWLLDHGADPNVGPPIGRPGPTPVLNSGNVLELAACSSNITVFDLLLERGAKLENSCPLHMAAGGSLVGESIPMMTHLLELGVDVNGSDKLRGARQRGTPLHHAVDSGCIENVRFLLENGADPHIKNTWGTTPIEEAERFSAPQIVELLRGSGSTGRGDRDV
ncbi:MAG: hypothetical protein M1813_003352 [Trichoglossum hirsutum]|nr:MAG: hypothetical protein M1813_003352 [Trichoglossum hirsutum]